MNEEVLAQLIRVINDVPILVARYGKDGQQMEAFVEDVKEAIKATESEEEQVLLFSALTLILLKAVEGIRRFKIWNFGSWDIFKPMRLRCDELARLLDFKRYKALRNL